MATRLAKCAATVALVASLGMASAAPTRTASPASPVSGERELVCLVEERHLDSWRLLEELAAEFGERHDVHVRLLPLGGASGQDKGRFLLAGDVPLDLLRIDVTEIAAFQNEGALVDLQPHFEADPTWDEAAYFPGVLEALRDERGHLLGLPSTFTPYVMYVNRDLLAELGAAAPGPEWTWDELLTLCRRATRDTDGRTDTYGISLTQWLQAVVPWVWQAGGELLDEQGTRARMAEPPFVAAMQFLHDLLHEEQVASFDASFENQLTQGLFQAGKALFYGPVGYWETFRFRHVDAFEWDVLPLPRRERAATAVAMTVYVVPRTAREPELAYRFLRLLAGERYQRELAAIGNGVPGLIRAARSESFLKPDVPPESERVFLDVLEDARFLPPLANWRKIESLCQAELEGILLVEDTDVAAACRRMAQKTDAYLLRERERGSLPRVSGAALGILVSIGLGAAALALLRLRGGGLGRLERREERAAFGMLGLWGTGFLAFFLVPALVSLGLSFCEWSPLRPLEDVRFAGGEPWSRLAADGTFRTSIVATTLYTLLSVPAGLVLALGLALFLSRETAANRWARTIAYVPTILSPVVVGAIWRHVLDADRGGLNHLLRGIGIEGPAWLRDPDWVVPALALTSLWTVGAQTLVFLAALKAVDRTLLEAARLDGAGRWARFRHVTLPAISPVVLFNAVTGTIAAFQVFAQPFVMTQGGPGDASRFLVLYLYETAFRHLDMGYASVLAWVLLAGLALLCLVVLRVSRPWVHYAARSRG